MKNSYNDVEILQTLVRCLSVTPKSDGILEYVQQLLTDLGFTTEIYEFTGDGSYAVKNLHAYVGSGENSLAFCGHLDVVPSGDETQWQVPPFSAEIVDGKIIGRGTEDMKGGVACFIAALANIIPSLNLSHSRIGLLLTLDEESLAVNGVPKLLKKVTQQGHNYNACLLGEPTCVENVGDTIKIGRRGSLNFKIDIVGQQGHVAYKHLFYNPSSYLSPVLAKLQSIDLTAKVEHFEKSNLEVTSVVSSTSVYNVVPRSITIMGNVRFNVAYTAEYIKGAITQCINEVIKEEKLTEEVLDMQVSFASDASEPFLVDKKSNIYSCMEQAISEVAGMQVSANTYGGTSDARFLKNYMPTIEFGLIEKTLHQVNEHVLVQDVQLLTQIYTKFLLLYFKG